MYWVWHRLVRTISDSAQKKEGKTKVQWQGTAANSRQFMQNRGWKATCSRCESLRFRSGLGWISTRWLQWFARLHVAANCRFSGALVTYFPPSPSAHFHQNPNTQLHKERHPGFGFQCGEKKKKKNQFPFQISLRRAHKAPGAGLRIRANLEPSQVSQLEKFTTSSLQRRARKVGFSEGFPELDFHRAQAAEKQSEG